MVEKAVIVLRITLDHVVSISSKNEVHVFLLVSHGNSSACMWRALLAFFGLVFIRAEGAGLGTEVRHAPSRPTSYFLQEIACISSENDSKAMLVTRFIPFLYTACFAMSRGESM